MSKTSPEQERHALMVLSPRLKKTGWAMAIGSIGIFIYAFFSPAIEDAPNLAISDEQIELGIPEEPHQGIEPGQLPPEALFVAAFLFATIGLSCVAFASKTSKKLHSAPENEES